jgi:cullin 1
MWTNLQDMLDNEKVEDLQRMCMLLSRVPEGLEALQGKFEEHVKRAGLAAVSKLVDERGTIIHSLNPEMYVNALLDVHRNNAEMVSRGFLGEAGFVVSLDKACREFVNRNAATGSLSTKSPELLVRHIDMLLRVKNEMVDGDLEGALTRVVCIPRILLYIL